MNKDNFVIYEDNSQKIEIDNRVHQYLNKVKEASIFYLDEQELDTLLYFATNKVKELNFTTLNNLVIVENIPVIKTQKNLSLAAPYNVFNETIYQISEFFDLDKDKKEKANIINEFCSKKNNGIKCYIFNRPIFNVYGFLIYHNKVLDYNYLLFFSFKTLREQLSDYLDILDLFNT